MQGTIHQGTPQPSDDAGQMRQEVVSPATTTNQSEASREVENEELSPESTETERHSSINGNEDTQSSSCVVINVDLENSAYEYGDGDGSSVLSSKTCSVEDISLTGVQEEVKAVMLNEGCGGKVTSEVRPGAPLAEVKQEPESVGTEENVAVVSVELPELSNQSPSVSVEEEEGTAGLKQAENQDYINPRGVRFMSQEIEQGGEYATFLFVSNVTEVEIKISTLKVSIRVKFSLCLIITTPLRCMGNGGNALHILNLDTR
jgi:hypothetical protein